LIVEDARSDRARFRLILERRPRTGFEFAWTWAAGRRSTVSEWFRASLGDAGGAPLAFRAFLAGLDEERQQQLATRLSTYRVVLLDLAWSGPAEQVMRGKQFMAEHEGQSLAKDVKDGGLPTNSAQDMFDVEGIALLEWMLSRPKKPGERFPSVAVTSAYVAETALGLRAFLRHRYAADLGIEIFHKWLDEAAISNWFGSGEPARR
jgi:hypothetical protein